MENLTLKNMGKKYLANLYKAGYNVVPTIDDINDINILPSAEEYIKKPYVAYDGFDMQIIKREEIENIKLSDEILQPKLNFKSEVQLYFVNDTFQYALEYSPSKWPDYSTPYEIIPNQKYIEQAKSIINLNSASCSFNRIDFLKLNNDEMTSLE